NSIAGGGCADVTAHPNCGNLPAGVELATNSTNNTNLIKKSDKLPIPDYGAAWTNVPFIAEFLRGLSPIGGPGFGSTLYNDATGTYGVGGSATYSLTPALSIGGGLAFIGASETQTRRGCAGIALGCGGAVFGDNAIELDGGIIWRYNPNLTIS